MERKLILKPSKVLRELTTLHGVKHLVSQNRRRRLFWWPVILANTIFTIYLTMVIMQRYQINQIYTKVDGTCRVNQVPFPTVSICNANIISQKQTQNLRNILKQQNITENTIDEWLEALQFIRRFGDGSQHVPSFDDVTSLLNKRYFTMESVMEEVHQKCDDLLLYCEFNRRQKNCARMFKIIKTLEGFCCALNYAALNNDVNEPMFDDGEDVEYYDDRKVGAIVTTSKSGRSSGLTVLLNIDPEDYPPFAAAKYYGAKIIISAPSDFPETTVMFKYITTGESMDIKVQPMVFSCDSRIRRIPATERGCWFHDEGVLHNTARYSFETCTTECRMKDYRSACQCNPYRYPKTNLRTCELKDLKCMYNVTVTGSQNCNCIIECSDNKYNIQSNLMPFSPYDYPKKYRRNLNVSQVAGLKVYFGQSSCNCFKKVLFMDYDRLIATYGGVGSLSAGASILTLAELLYLAASYIVAVIWMAIQRALKKFGWRNGVVNVVNCPAFTDAKTY